MTEHLKSVRTGLFLSTLAIVLGFTLGGIFGAFEEPVKDWLQSEGTSVLDTVYHGNTAQMEKVVKKSWVYFKRAHMHGGGIGTATLTLCLLLAFLPRIKFKSWTATGLGFGALGYSIFWLLAGIRAPTLGSTSLAKESLKWLAFPSAGLLLLGTLASLLFIVTTLWKDSSLLEN